MCVCIYDGDGGGRKVNGQKMVYVLGEKKNTSTVSISIKSMRSSFCLLKKNTIFCALGDTLVEYPYDFAL